MPTSPTGDHVGQPFTTQDTEQSIVSRFGEQARRYPDHPAVESTEESLSYAELDRRSNQIAHLVLNTAGRAIPEGPVAILIGQRAATVSAMLGVLKAGRAYLPLDPAHPIARLRQILSVAKSDFVLSTSECASIAAACAGGKATVRYADRIPGNVSGSQPAVSIAPDHPAFMLFTSGSTGCPKGVVQTHRNVLCNIRNYTNDIHIGPSDRLSLLPSFGFAASVSDLFGALLNGASACLFDFQQGSVQSCRQWLREQRISVYYSVPSVFRLLMAPIAEADSFPDLRIVKLGGDLVTHTDVALYRRHCPDSCRLLISLGATEINLICRSLIAKNTPLPEGVVPMGYPPEGVELRLVDERGEPVARGEVGELEVRSAHVSPGYWGEAPAHSSRIRPAADAPGCRVFRTGDIGRLLDNGQLVHLGRRDARVKIGGQTVSLVEVEAALAQAPGVGAAVVVSDAGASGEKRLVAYVTAAGETPPSVGEIRRFLEQSLPRYMVPQALVVVDGFRYGANGKLDRSALAAQAPAESGSTVDQATARGVNLETEICAIWRDVLGANVVNPGDGFFELGGSSLLAFRTIEEIRRTFGVSISLGTFFDNATPERLSVAVRRLLDNN